MMQATESGHRYNAATCTRALLCFATRRRFLHQPEMRPVVVIVTDILVHQTLQMAFIHNNHMVEQITSAVADPALCDTVLPRTSEAGSIRLNAKALHGRDDFLVEVCTCASPKLRPAEKLNESL